MADLQPVASENPVPLPPYSYVPGHGHPHPVTDPRGHSHGHDRPVGPFAPAALATLSADESARRRAIAALVAADAQWRYAADLFNEGFYWEAHEAWEHFWHALGRTTPEARFIQGLIHLAAACVKIREGKPTGVATHTRRARELLGGSGAVQSSADSAGALGLERESIEKVLAELESYTPECWHSARATVVRVVVARLKVAGGFPVGVDASAPARFLTVAADGLSYDINGLATEIAPLADAASGRPWEAVRSDFDRARALLLPLPPGAEGSAARLAEWLDHNELELALDELESLGAQCAAPREYWEHLRSASERMGLAGHMARLSRRASDAAEPGAAADERGHSDKPGRAPA